MSRLALAWSGHEEIMLVWLQFCFPIESTISSGFPVISNNDLSLLAKLENFFQPSYGLANRWGDSCLGMKCFITGAGGRPSLEAPLVTGAKLLKAPQQWRLIILSALTFIIKLSRAQQLPCCYTFNQVFDGFGPEISIAIYMLLLHQVRNWLFYLTVKWVACFHKNQILFHVEDKILKSRTLLLHPRQSFSWISPAFSRKWTVSLQLIWNC